MKKMQKRLDGPGAKDRSIARSVSLVMVLLTFAGATPAEAEAPTCDNVPQQVEEECIAVIGLVDCRDDCEDPDPCENPEDCEIPDPCPELEECLPDPCFISVLCEPPPDPCENPEDCEVPNPCSPLIECVPSSTGCSEVECNIDMSGGLDGVTCSLETSPDPFEAQKSLQGETEGAWKALIKAIKILFSGVAVPDFAELDTTEYYWRVPCTAEFMTVIVEFSGGDGAMAGDVSFYDQEGECAWDGGDCPVVASETGVSWIADEGYYADVQGEDTDRPPRHFTACIDPDLSATAAPAGSGFGSAEDHTHTETFADNVPEGICIEEQEVEFTRDDS